MCFWGYIKKFFGVYNHPSWDLTNHEKIKTLKHMTPPKNIKEVQCLNGRITFLSYSLVCLGDKYLLILMILRGEKHYLLLDRWMLSCFWATKEIFGIFPLLSKLIQGGTLYLYLVFSHLINPILVWKENVT